MTQGAFMTLADVAAALPGAALLGDPAFAIQRVHTDTRTLQPGDLFVALRGERFDAHDFLSQLGSGPAVAALAERGLAQAGVPGVQVSDSRQALGALAAAWRGRFEIPLIAVTGSNGKTTVTQMLASVLRAHWGALSLATQGNLNNDIGVPLTLLRLRPGHEAAVVELGMNHPGEIAGLAAMAQPTVALVNNAQREHQEFMGSVDAVAEENAQVFKSLRAGGTAVFPADEPYANLWQGLAGEAHLMRFSATEGVSAEVSLIRAQWLGALWQVLVRTPVGELSYRLRLAGLHNVRNSLAVVACALAAGVPAQEVARGIGAFEPVQGRSRAWQAEQRSPAGATVLTVVDDTYNANPDSVRAAVDVLASLPGPHLLVLGDMGEVGEQGPAFHAEAGAHARERGIEHLYAIGELSGSAVEAFGGGRHFTDIEALKAEVVQALGGCASVLVKGSRFMKMERVVEAIAAATHAIAQEDGHEPSA